MSGYHVLFEAERLRYTHVIIRTYYGQTTLFRRDVSAQDIPSSHWTEDCIPDSDVYATQRDTNGLAYPGSESAIRNVSPYHRVTTAYVGLQTHQLLRVCQFLFTFQFCE